MKTHSLGFCLLHCGGLVLPDDQVLHEAGNHPGHEPRVHVYELLQTSVDVLLGHHHEVEVVLQESPHRADDGLVLRRRVEHVDVELLGQVVDDRLRIGNDGSVIVGYPGTLALCTGVLLEVCLQCRSEMKIKPQISNRCYGWNRFFPIKHFLMSHG